ncbi:MAG: RNase adapter RapZ [Betaproteobacteria bacterium]|nr:RNase adapter RapZ [Betaproteobacteria bacterium]
MEIVLISGLSGSGKSVALKALEDRGYYCVDNLPVAMLDMLVGHMGVESRLGVVVDARSGGDIAGLPEKIAALRQAGHHLLFLFLETQDEVLIQRFSETRRRHPLTSESRTLMEALLEERRLLLPLAELGQRLDTSGLRPSALREWVLQSADVAANEGLTLLIESFGFKNGLPRDADLVFDVRCLPNPFHDPALSPLTGLDAPVIDFLEADATVRRLREDIQRFVADWLPAWFRDSRAYLTVAVGCTGGQHRSVYLAEWLGRQFQGKVSRVLVRHRGLAA